MSHSKEIGRDFGSGNWHIFCETDIQNVPGSVIHVKFMISTLPLETLGSIAFVTIYQRYQSKNLIR